MILSSYLRMAQGPYGLSYSFFLTVVILVNIASFVLSTEQNMDDYRAVFESSDFRTMGR